MRRAPRRLPTLLQTLLPTLVQTLVLAAGLGGTVSVQAQQLDAKFSCSVERTADRQRDGDRRLLADTAEFHLQAGTARGFRWESSLFRSTHGFDCSIDDSDGVQAEVLPAEGDGADRWRVTLIDARLARTRRGYDADHGINCSIRLVRRGQQLQILPSCPALCGSRENFSALTVNLKTGQCDYEQ